MIAVALDVLVFVAYFILHMTIVLVAVYIGVMLHSVTEWVLSKISKKNASDLESWSGPGLDAPPPDKTPLPNIPHRSGGEARRIGRR